MVTIPTRFFLLHNSSPYAYLFAIFPYTPPFFFLVPQKIPSICLLFLVENQILTY